MLQIQLFLYQVFKVSIGHISSCWKLLYSFLQSQDRGLHANETDEYVNKFNSISMAQRVFEKKRQNKIIYLVFTHFILFLLLNNLNQNIHLILVKAQNISTLRSSKQQILLLLQRR